jgi:hypothetical protein
MNIKWFNVTQFIQSCKGTIMYGIIPIILGVIILLNHERLLNYSTHINDRYGIPVSREIMSTRLIVATVFFLIMGLIIILKTNIK